MSGLVSAGASELAAKLIDFVEPITPIAVTTEAAFVVLHAVGEVGADDRAGGCGQVDDPGPRSKLGRCIAHPRPAARRSSTPRARVVGSDQRAGCGNCVTVWLGRSYPPGLAD
jgi:hypothetical protein